VFETPALGDIFLSLTWPIPWLQFLDFCAINLTK
jgi:hypothetical protein